MPRQNTHSKSTLPVRLARVGRLNIAIMAAFVLVFATVGGMFIYHSEASAWYCTQHLYYQGEPGIYHGYCVYQIQAAMDDLQGVVGYINQDGIYGPATANAVRKFQQYDHMQVSGQVGVNTWNNLCYALDGGPIGQYGGYLDIQTYNNLGCYHKPYASHPVN